MRTRPSSSAPLAARIFAGVPTARRPSSAEVTSARHSSRPLRIRRKSSVPAPTTAPTVAPRAEMMPSSGARRVVCERRTSCACSAACAASTFACAVFSPVRSCCVSTVESAPVPWSLRARCAFPSASAALASACATLARACATSARTASALKVASTSPCFTLSPTFTRTSSMRRPGTSAPTIASCHATRLPLAASSTGILAFCGVVVATVSAGFAVDVPASVFSLPPSGLPPQPASASAKTSTAPAALAAAPAFIFAIGRSVERDAFVGHHLLHRGARKHPVGESAVVPHLAHRHLLPVAPAVEHQQVAVDRRVTVADAPLAAREQAVDLAQVVLEAHARLGADRFLRGRVVGVARGADEVAVSRVHGVRKPCHGRDRERLVPRVLGPDARLGIAASEVRDDADVLGDDVAVEDAGRHTPARVELQVLGLALVPRGEVEALGLVRYAHLLDRDVRGEGAGAGRVVELYGHCVLRIGPRAIVAGSDARGDDYNRVISDDVSQRLPPALETSS